MKQPTQGGLAKNIGYNMILQLVTALLPFVVTPYVARVLQPTGNGIYSFTHSIVNYFVLFAGIGLSVYGTRQIAFKKDDPTELSKTFAELFWLKGITTLAAVVVFLVCMPLLAPEYTLILLLQGIQLLAVLFDISWLYAGLGQFKISVTRTLIVKVLTILATFLFVREVQDLWLYVLICAIGALCTNLAMWYRLGRHVRFARVRIKDILKTVKPVSVVFISFLAIEVYTVLDKTMIGVLSTQEQVAVYTYAEQFAKAGLGIIGAISTVLLPYMSSLKQSGDERAFVRNFNNSLSIVSMVGIAASFGIAGVAEQFIPWMLGDGYEASIMLLMLLSPLTTIISTSNIVSRAYLLPANRERVCNIGVISAACINVLLNALLIPRFAALGACVATLIAEVSVTLVYLVCSRSVLHSKRYLLSLLKYVGAGLCMFFGVRGIGALLGAHVWTTVLQVAFGVTLYGIALLLLRDALALQLFRTVKNKLFKRT